VALIITDVSEDRIAFHLRILRVVAYTRAYNFALYLLALVHPEDGGDTILRNVGSYKSHTASSPRRL
jgi:hypothetical protein